MELGNCPYLKILQLHDIERCGQHGFYFENTNQDYATGFVPLTHD